MTVLHLHLRWRASAGASVAGVFDVLKTAEHNQNSAILPEQETSRDDGKFSRRGADDNSPYTQEPCEVESLMHGSVVAVGWETTPPTTSGLLLGCKLLMP